MSNVFILGYFTLLYLILELSSSKEMQKLYVLINVQLIAYKIITIIIHSHIIVKTE